LASGDLLFAKGEARQEAVFELSSFAVQVLLNADNVVSEIEVIGLKKSFEINLDVICVNGR